MPLLGGSNTVRLIAVAMAASMALPPLFKMSRPAWAASVCDVQTMPFFPYTTLRREGYLLAPLLKERNVLMAFRVIQSAKRD